MKIAMAGARGGAGKSITVASLPGAQSVAADGEEPYAPVVLDATQPQRRRRRCGSGSRPMD